MLRSMSSAISGLKINQTDLDVIGNNIANMGTTGYKTQSLTFADSLSQSMRDPNAPSPTLGGSNGIQIGLGAGIAGVNTLLTQGNFSPTSRNLDNAIDGEGYFAVAEGPALFDSTAGSTKESITVDAGTHKVTASGNPRGANIMYTRDGSFNLDQEGNLVTSSGLRVLGYSVIDNTSAGYGTGSARNQIESIGNDGNINFVDANAIDSGKFSTIRVAAASGASGVYTNELKTMKIPDVIKCPTTTSAGSAVFNPSASGASGNYQLVKVKSFSIDKSGLVKAVLDNGSTSVIGQIAMASFANPAGLVKLGNNAVQSSPNSGDPTFKSGYVAKYDTANTKDQALSKDDNSKAFGNVENGVLEMSNVDIAEQFTKMIQAERSFQANGKVITTGDQILQDLVNLIR